MSEIRVMSLGPQRYSVDVVEGTIRTTHKVALTDDLIDDLDLTGVDPEVLVEEAFAFLLEREPASAIRGDFPVEQIAQRYPEFYDELRTRLT